MAQALSVLLNFGKDNQKFRLKEINLDDNGLKDDSFAKILSCIEN